MSVFEDVVHWCDEITQLLEREISVRSVINMAMIALSDTLGRFDRFESTHAS